MYDEIMHSRLMGDKAEVFERAIEAHFAPVITGAGLTLARIAAGVYEVAGREIAMRLRAGTGHKKDMLMTLVRRRGRTGDPYDLHDEIGAGWFAKQVGITMPEFSVDSEEGYMRSAFDLAQVAKTALLPYLLGTRLDFGVVEAEVFPQSGAH
ncbi:MAG TPA: hypothetical protein VHO06_08340 [Polyangia bacterium]|nr:hypothetical protein [Polyangia bacterium]